MSSSKLKLRSIFSESLTARGLAIAKTVGARLCERELVAHAIKTVTEQVTPPDFFNWTPTALWEGNVGLALASCFLDQCFPERGFDKAAHQYIKDAVEALNSGMYLQSGLNGISGIAFTTKQLSRDGRRYQNLMQIINEAILERLLSDVDLLANTIPGPPTAAFDVISGLCGTLGYLLSSGDNCFEQQIEIILSLLVKLADSKGGLPNWFTPYEYLSELQKPHCPEGNLNAGLAHGIPGPLAALSIAKIENRSVQGLDNAIHKLASWLMNNVLRDEWGVNWPYYIPLHKIDGHVVAPLTDTMISKAAWCYGAPGIARSLWLAGVATKDKSLTDFSLAAMKSIMNRPESSLMLAGSGLCHGQSGLVQICMRFAYDSDDIFLKDQCNIHLSKLLDMYDSNLMFGFTCPDSSGKPLDKPGLLEGSAGIILAILSCVGSIEPAWDRILLLS
jgi:hypothetical protein